MAKIKKITPSANTCSPAELWKLSEYDFENLCCAIYQGLTEIRIADIFGIRGEAQYGIDIKAHRIDNGLEVAQCKCYQDFPPAKIRAAAQEFLKHWSNYWKNRDVRKFILFVSCDLSKTKRQEAIEECIEDFKKIGVKFEAWSNRAIEHHLKKHPEIVSRYFDPPDYWVEKICGKKLEAYNSDPFSQTILIETINKYASKDLENIAILFREGKRNTALKEIEQIKADSVRWKAIDKVNKSKILRIEANLHLYEPNGLDKAKILADEADKLYKSGDPSQLRTLITWTQEGPEKAYKEIENIDNRTIIILKATLLAALNRFDDLKTLLINFSGEDEEKAEYHRLIAMASLYEGNLDQALREIDDALGILPKGKLLLQTKGALLFYKALSPAILPKHVMSWPEPVDWLLVRRDEHSVQHLRKAEEIFTSLLNECEPDKEEKHSWQSWKLGCLACNSSSLDDAEAYCQELLFEDRCHTMAIAWATTRGFLEDKFLARSRKALENLREEKKASIGHILSLCSIYVRNERLDKADNTLNQSRSLFEKQNELALWSFWKIQINGSKADATQLDTEDDRNHRIELINILNKFKETDDLSELTKKAEQIIKDNSRLEILADICGILYRRKKWHFLAKNAVEICKKIGTSDAVEMTVYSCFQEKEYEILLNVVDNFQSFFPNNELPIDIRRAKLTAQRALGNLPDAVKEAKRLADQTKDLNDFIGLVDLLVYQGNIQEVARTVHHLRLSLKIESNQTITTRQALYFSRILSCDDPSLAKDLLRDAVKQGLTTNELADAHFLSLTLGISNEFKHLAQQFHTAVSAGHIPGVKSKSMEDLIKMIEQSQKQSQNREKAYHECNAPIHAIADVGNIPLAHLYHKNLVVNESAKNLAATYPLFARHGGRGISNTFPRTPADWHLCMDITALLLSSYTNILNEIEKCFKPIRIPSGITYALQKMIIDVSPKQPDRIDATKNVLKAYEAGKINVLDSVATNHRNDFITTAKKNGAKILSWSRTNTKDETFPTELLINCGFLANSLADLGHISQRTYEKLIQSLGTEAAISVGTGEITENQIIYCDDGLLEEISKAEFLNIVIDQFEIYMTSRELEHCRAYVSETEHASKLSDWVCSLRNRISQGIENGIYQILPAVTIDDEHEKKYQSDQFSIAILESLLKIPPDDKCIIWFDDRIMNGYMNAGAGPIVCLHDIAKALVHYKEISNEQYFQIIEKLRKGNVRFIPAEAEEIIFHLSNAPQKRGNIQETPELKILRQYFAGCFLENSGLISPDQAGKTHNPDGEILFLVHHHQAVNNAIVKIWIDETKTVERKEAESKWIMDKLFIEQYPLLPAWVHTKEDHFKLLSFRYNDLLTNALSISRKTTDDGKSLRANYIEWIYKHVIEKRLEANPKLINQLCTIFADFLVHIFFKEQPDRTKPNLTDSKIFPAVRTELRKNLIGLLPESIETPLMNNPDIQRYLGLSSNETQLLPIGNCYFKPDEFDRAVTAAARGKESILKTWNEKQEFSISFDVKPTKDNIVFLFKNNKQDERSFRLVDPVNGVFLPTIEERINYFIEKNVLFDLSKGDLEKILKNEMNIADARERISKIHCLLKNSAANYYKELQNLISVNQKFSLDELIPPSGKTLLLHLRLNLKSKLPNAFESSAVQLISDYGIEETLVRFASLPCKMPVRIMNHLESLDEKERIKVFEEWRKRVFSPLSLFQFVHVVSQFTEWDKNELTEKTLGAYLTDPELEIINSTFLSILKWVNNAFGHWEGALGWSSSMRLAMTWMHSDKLMATFMSVGSPDKNFKDFFGEQNRRFAIRNHLDKVKNGSDIADPDLLSSNLFMIQGVGYAMQALQPEYLSEDAATILEEACSFKTVEETTLALDLMRDLSVPSNVLNSFLRQDAKIILDTLGFDELSKQYEYNAFQELLCIQLDSRESKDQQPLAWMYVLTVLPYHKAPKNLQDKYFAFLLNTDFSQLWEHDPRISAIALAYSADVAAQNKNVELQDHIEKQILKCATLLCAVKKEERNQTRHHLLSAAWALSLKSGDADIFASDLAFILRKLIDILPDAIPLALEAVQSVCEDLPICAAQKLWPILIYLRGI